MVEHQHVRLLEHLRPARPLPAEQQIGRDRPAWSDFGDQERLERVEARELLVDAARRLVPVDERVGYGQPLGPVSVANAGAQRHGAGSSAPSRW